jgi:hypothetical protein
MKARCVLRNRSWLTVEWLEKRVVLTGPSYTVPLDPFLDEFGTQILTVQAYGDPTRTALSILDTGASPVTFSADDQAIFISNGNPIPIKVPGGAQSDGIGGSVVGDVSQPDMILADGLHAATITFDSFGFPLLDVTFTSTSAQAEGIQAFVGTYDGSPILPTITGTPIFNKSSFQPSGVAAKVDMQGFLFDLGDGTSVGLPDVHFVVPETTLTPSDGDAPVIRLPLDFYGTDNSDQPGNDITSSRNLVDQQVTLTESTAQLSGQTFLLDTGAQLSIISTDEANALNLDLSHPETTITVQGVGGTEEIPGFTLDSLQVPISGGGSLTFTHVPVFVLDIAPGIDGLLGMNLWNSADSLLINPNDPQGASLSITFLTSGGITGGAGGGGFVMMNTGAQGTGIAGIHQGHLGMSTPESLAQLLGQIASEVHLPMSLGHADPKLSPRMSSQIGQFPPSAEGTTIHQEVFSSAEKDSRSFELQSVAARLVQETQRTSPISANIVHASAPTGGGKAAETIAAGVSDSSGPGLRLFQTREVMDRSGHSTIPVSEEEKEIPLSPDPNMKEEEPLPIMTGKDESPEPTSVSLEFPLAGRQVNALLFGQSYLLDEADDFTAVLPQPVFESVASQPSTAAALVLILAGLDGCRPGEEEWRRVRRGLGL